MPTTIRVMSWNIESLGEEKGTKPGTPAQKTALMTYICRVINQFDVDVIGIMELKGGQGQQVSGWLVGKLNGQRPLTAAYTWKSKVSSRQDGGTQEQYILAWKDQPNHLVLDPDGDPGPTALLNVLDDNVLATFIARKHWSTADTATFYSSMESNGYIGHVRFKDRSKMVLTDTWRINGDQWDHLHRMMTPEVTFDMSRLPHPPAMTRQDRKDLAAKLLTIDILRFVSTGERSPYLASFRVGNPARPFMTALLHAPGPQDMDRFPAINSMALIAPFQAPATNPNLLVMGDFNIKATEMNDQARVWGRYLKDGHFGFHEVTPVDFRQIFVPLTSPPVGLTRLALAPDDRTSLINGYEADVVPPGDVLLNTYDKFLLRGPAANNPRCLNLAQMGAFNQPVYDARLGRSMLSFFRYYRGAAFLTKQRTELAKKEDKANRQYQVADKAYKNAVIKENAAIKGGTWTKTCAVAKRVKDTKAKRVLILAAFAAFTAQLTALDNLITLEANRAIVAATGMGTAAAIYRYGVSDHLPIVTELTFT
jgi:hypothetical protein